MSSRALRRANRATASEIADAIPSTTLHEGITFSCKVSTGPRLSAVEREDVWQIFEDNMKGLYVNSVFGWDPPAKRDEMFHPLARYVLLHRPHSEHDDDSDGQDMNGRRSLVAYAGFRFEDEEGENVLYCYELQVSKSEQGHGLGKFLMQQVFTIGRWWQMEKVMLTVLKANTAARNFYESQGSPAFESHVKSFQESGEPGQSKTCGETADSGGDAWEDEEDVVDCDYEILSKAITSG
ncbi:hypothetical protein OE88DRAFT_108009 [Heliocybe sulcata]|uniref:N-alpha-acetyltransferase 40 n=1 Tax=Heliocybe sulcata TaxID=5364 RepID=A0A5C3NHM5_9AGAM|nr:hypothetical protein OE88DRAFT_108009 [Heliocybe sulcata]